MSLHDPATLIFMQDGRAVFHCSIDNSEATLDTANTTTGQKLYLICPAGHQLGEWDDRTSFESEINALRPR